MSLVLNIIGSAVFWSVFFSMEKGFYFEHISVLIIAIGLMLMSLYEKNLILHNNTQLGEKK